MRAGFYKVSLPGGECRGVSPGMERQGARTHAGASDPLECPELGQGSNGKSVSLRAHKH